MQIAKDWRIQRYRYSLIGTECVSCGLHMFPPRDVCLQCTSHDMKEYCFSGNGVIYSFSQLFVPALDHVENTPYIIALVSLDEGPLVVAQLTDVDYGDVEMNMPVEMVTRKLSSDGEKGIIRYAYKFRPKLLC